jgi:hypothetical protein
VYDSAYDFLHDLYELVCIYISEKIHQNVIVNNFVQEIALVETPKATKQTVKTSMFLDLGEHGLRVRIILVQLRIQFRVRFPVHSPVLYTTVKSLSIKFAGRPSNWLVALAQHEICWKYFSSTRCNTIIFLRNPLTIGTCPKGSLLTVRKDGRLGNQMGEYASLFAHSKRLGVQGSDSPNFEVYFLFRNSNLIITCAVPTAIVCVGSRLRLRFECAVWVPISPSAAKPVRYIDIGIDIDILIWEYRY